MAVRAGLRAVLIDLSGTLHIEDNIIPGAVEALERLRAAPVKLKFVTNTTKESTSTLHQRLQRLGFDIGVHDIFSSLTAARNVVTEGGLRPMLLLQEDARKDFEGIPTDSPNSVVVGLSPDSFNYATLNLAFRLLLDDAKLIAIHKARYYKRLDGLALGPGPFVEALEYASGTKASVLGKPEKAFFLEALKSLGCRPDEAVMIGDDARDDVEGAVAAGLQGILVKTGKYRQGDEDRIQLKATAVCRDFPEAVEHIFSKML
ncbi:haloacid dehalogenase-like hydrolase domain-containing protein 2 [Acanthaster planci]|uniref:Haloacid dehalogenase-like hydrolase domain-containing protein 2 n=1 Tax=Acanthaster planci TaxID=133434 RepID=A0A8B7XRT6_ACAPL|nr:haloacid dehalogenase-like hydrolase domain-containing protein 2 [Acanthaster planci]